MEKEYRAPEKAEPGLKSAIPNMSIEELEDLETKIAEAKSTDRALVGAAI